MTAGLVAMQTSLPTSDMNNGAETETDGRMFELREPWTASDTITATTTDAERTTILKGKKNCSSI